MSAQRDFVVEDGPTFDEALKADANTVRSRQWASDLFASHAALKSAVWEIYGDRLKDCFGIEAAKTLTEGFETIRALVDASGRDDSESLHIRFHCAAWMAQQFKARALFPKGASEEEKKRMRARLTRQWGRTGWPSLHLMQCATGLPFFRRDVMTFDANRAREAAVYENEYTDLLLDVRRRARAFRRKHTVWRYEQAAREALRAYIERKDFRHYAPDWRPEQPDAPKPEAGSDGEEDSPTVKVENIALRSAARAAKIAAQLPDEEADACAVLFFERAAETWQKETGRVFPYVPPVLRRADNEKNSDPTSCTRGHIEECDFPAKNEDLPTPSVDNLSAVEVLEFDPEEEPRGVSFADADGAATACASVGIETVKVVFIDDTKPRGAPDGCTLAEELSLAEFQDRLPVFLERNRASSAESFTVRLRRKEDTRLIQLDDCSREVLDLIKPFVFLAFQTSPANWQAWLCLAEILKTEDYDETRRRLLTFLKPTGANGGAYGASRWPGSKNNKPNRRYADGEAPRVVLSYVALGRRASVAELEAAGLLAPPRPKPTAADVRAIMSRLPDPNDWPDMNQYLAECDGDRSRAESKWAVRALGMGHTRHAVEAELERIGEKARVRRRDNYVRETVEKAAQWVGLNPRREVTQHTQHAGARERGTI